MATIKWRAGGTRPATINKNLFISLGFMPTSIAGCTLWLDSTDSGSITFSSGSNVGQWRDKSGAGNHFGTVAGTVTRITDGSFSVINIASGGIMSSANQITFTTSSAFFIVSKITGVATWGNMLLGFSDINGGDTSIRFEEFMLRGTRGTGNGNDLASGTYYVNGTLNPSFGSSTYLNVYSIIGTVAPQSGGTSFLTFSSSFLGRYFIGNIAEFLFYPGGVTSTQRENIESYLAQKWGLTASLPVGHLHLTQPVSLISTPAINPGRLFKRTIVIIDPTAKYSAFFSSANNTLSMPSNAVFELGTNNHTIEFWFYHTSRGAYDTIFAYGNNPPQWTSRSNYYINMGSNQFLVVLGNGSGGWEILLSGGTLVTLNTWHHYALVRNGSTFTLYINGTSRGTATTSAPIGTQVGSLVVGSHGVGGGDGYTGYISNFRFVVGTAVYTSNFTPPTSPLTAIPNTQLLIQGLVDRSPNAFTLTNTNSVTLATNVSPFP
jgi:hypothetical protein